MGHSAQKTVCVRERNKWVFLVFFQFSLFLCTENCKWKLSTWSRPARCNSAQEELNWAGLFRLWQRGSSMHKHNYAELKWSFQNTAKEGTSHKNIQSTLSYYLPALFNLFHRRSQMRQGHINILKKCKKKCCWLCLIQKELNCFSSVPLSMRI